MRFKSLVVGMGLLVIVAGAVGAWIYFTHIDGKWCETNWTVELPPVDGDMWDGWLVACEAAPCRADRLNNYLKWRDWTHRLKPGRYSFSPDETIRQSAAKLVVGDRQTVNVVVPSGRDVGPIAGSIARRIWADSAEVASLLELDSNMWRVVPNTYDMWWETNAQQALARLTREHDAWWTEDRLALARTQGLTPREVTILASIVQAETSELSEAPVVAGLYLNRLNKGMPLQADPTLIFALNDPTIRRVLDVHKTVDSPYNTYMHTGLPPGPIRYVDPRYLLAVLSPAKHDYLYMCAEPGLTGTHRFAASYRKHLRNARAYQKWLNTQRIYR